ncbi:hypothetical protein Tco_1276248 [Tanacetum coccineum]
MFFRRSVSIRCQGYIGDFVLGCHAKDMVALSGLDAEDPVEAALQAPPSPDYVPGPEEPEQAPPSPDYVPGPEHADDEIVAKDQPYAKDASPTAQSPDYVPKSNPEANPEEDDDEDLEEDPVNYLVMEEMTESSGEPSEEDMIDDVDLEADEVWRSGAPSSAGICSWPFTSLLIGPSLAEGD